MKRLMRSIITLMLVTSVIIVSTTTAVAAGTGKHIDYVAFGDSVAAGVLYGGPNYPGAGSGLGYTDKIAEKLEQTGVLASFNKEFAVSGETAAGLAAKTAVLNVKDTPQWHLVKNAEIVTLDIGANDLLAPLYSYFVPMIADHKSDLYLNPGKVMADVAALIGNTDVTSKGAEIQGNIETILQNILNANKKVKIYVMGYYNPLPALAAQYDLNLDPQVDILNNLIKGAISNAIADNKGVSINYVDTKDIMKTNEYLVPMDIHPTALGYQAIADEFWKQIKPDLR